MKTILSISSHVVAGRVGQSISTFAFERLGLAVFAVPTVLYPVTPAPGAPRGEAVPQAIFDLLLKGISDAGALGGLGALHIGYLRTKGQVLSAARVIALLREKSPHAPVFLDPILGDEPGGLYVPKETADAIASELAPHADILTPNLFELGFLVGRSLGSESDAVAAARSLNARVVVVTSAPSAAERANTLLIEQGRAQRLYTPRFAHAPHGTGDLLAALFLARLVRGEAAIDALALAISSVYGLIGAANEASLSYLPHVECQDLLAVPAFCVEVEAIA
ncbi:MAG: pyridoxal kinase [Alphaproteobacteria bacterium]